MLISENKVKLNQEIKFLLQDPVIGIFLTMEVAADECFIHAFNWVFHCQILYNPLISGIL